MTSAFFRRRAVAAFGAAAFSVAALAACDKPTPLSQITVGGSTANTEAQCYKHGKSLSQKAVVGCLEKKSGASIEVGEGETLRIGVDPEVAENGWMLFVDGRPAQDPSKRTYSSFGGDQFFEPPTGPNGQQQSQQQPQQEKKNAKISVVEINDDGEYKGVWSIDIKKEKV